MEAGSLKRWELSLQRRQAVAHHIIWCLPGAHVELVQRNYSYSGWMGTMLNLS